MNDYDADLVHELRFLLIRLANGREKIEKCKWQFFPAYVVNDRGEIIDEGLEDLDWSQYIK